MQELQKVWFQEEVEKLTRAGETWVTVKAMKLAMNRMVAEQRRRMDERNKRLGLASGANAITAGAALNAADMDTGEVPMVKLGDASVAAPFTSKLPSIRSCVDVVRQGRCTLVSTIQMQQILALNCLIAAYSLSALFLDGVRSGEAQMIASGILLTVASLAFTYARPVQVSNPSPGRNPGRYPVNLSLPLAFWAMGMAWRGGATYTSIRYPHATSTEEWGCVCVCLLPSWVVHAVGLCTQRTDMSSSSLSPVSLRSSRR